MAPESAPAAIALPPAIKARKRAAKGNNPPFYDLFLLIFFFASRVESTKSIKGGSRT